MRAATRCPLPPRMRGGSAGTPPAPRPPPRRRSRASGRRSRTSAVEAPRRPPSLPLDETAPPPVTAAVTAPHPTSSQGAEATEGKAMRIFVAGATGAVGKRLVPMLVASGHEVTATTRSTGKAGLVREMGAEPAVVDVLDRDAAIAAVKRAEPEAIVHEATALTGMGSNMRRIARDFALTNRLRTEGTDNLLAAARAAGGGRLPAPSLPGWAPP